MPDERRRTGAPRPSRLAGSLLLAGVVLVGVGACADRPHRGRDSSVVRASAVEPTAAFRAHLGRTWELTRLGSQDIPAPRAGAVTPRARRYPGPHARPTIRFTAELVADSPGDTATFSAGGWSFCNAWGTGYRLGPGDQLRFHGFQSTLVGCDGPDSVETRFFRALHQTRRFEVDATTLVLVAADGSRIRFVASRDPGGAPTR